MAVLTAHLSPQVLSVLQHSGHCPTGAELARALEHAEAATNEREKCRDIGMLQAVSGMHSSYIQIAGCARHTDIKRANKLRSSISIHFVTDLWYFAQC